MLKEKLSAEIGCVISLIAQRISLPLPSHLAVLIFDFSHHISYSINFHKPYLIYRGGSTKIGNIYKTSVVSMVIIAMNEVTD